jgi:hypothetical protein
MPHRLDLDDIPLVDCMTILVTLHGDDNAGFYISLSGGKFCLIGTNGINFLLPFAEHQSIECI